jgi:hypothetical protein
MTESKETPKKVYIDNPERCFLCSKIAFKNNKVFLFGRSSVDIPGLLKSACVDAYKYSDERNDLFICKDICYKRILKFQNALQKYEKIKDEIREQFHSNARFRTKRLLSTDEQDPEKYIRSTPVQRVRLFSSSDTDISHTESSATRSLGEASNPILLDNVSLDVNAAVLKSHPQVAQVNNMSFLSKLQKKLTHTGITANFVHPCGSFAVNDLPSIFPTSSQPTASIATVGSDLTDFIPPRSSTPISRRSRVVAPERVSLTINYSSKTTSKTLDDTYSTIGKALFHGPPSRIATAIIKCEPLRKVIIQKLLPIVSREVGQLCSRKCPSILRKTSKNDLMNFSLEELCEEWEKRAPVFYSFLLTSCITKSTKNACWLPSVAIAGSVLLKQRNGEMNATANVLGILLKSRSTEVSIRKGQFQNILLNIKI